MSRALKVLEKGGLVHLERLASVLLITASQLLGPLLCATENAILHRQAGIPSPSCQPPRRDRWTNGFRGASSLCPLPPNHCPPCSSFRIRPARALP
jgi:hypothetical protein